MKKLLIVLTLFLGISACATRVVVCSNWNEIRMPDGRIYTERVCREH